ncbi:MAG TPA: GAF domain-containing protein, partial [Pyrinomonadaceae bacterium]
AQTRQPVQVLDLRETRAYLDREPVLVSAVEVAGIRTMFSVPMLKKNQLVGTISIYRQEVRPFTEKQIELVQNFAAQAVIAVENTRLLRELRESLQEQTATTDVLKVISRSTFDLQAVLSTLVESACRLCDAEGSAIWRPEGDEFKLAANFGHSGTHLTAMRQLSIRPGRETCAGRVLLEKQTVHIPDCKADQEYRAGDTLKAGGNRAMLGVPLLREGLPVGVFTLIRTTARPFTEKQIELAESFADQAVIAIENTRLLNELRQRTDDLSEALEQQTATSEVLQVISSSPGELEPVFQTMLENATRICNAKFGNLYRREGDAYQLVSTHGLSPAIAEDLRRAGPRRPPPNTTALGRVIATKRTAHIADALNELGDLNPPPGFTGPSLVKLAGARTVLGVPMLKQDELVGAIVVYRTEVRPFTDKQIDLISNFAAQAVIAIENVRLFKELRSRTHELTLSLNNLRNTQDRLVQTQKLALLGQLTAGIAHEIKNPLNFVNNFSGISAELITELQVALEDVTLDDKRRGEITELMDTLRSNLDKVVQHGKRADAIVKNMLLHSREGSGEHRLVDINVIVEESINLAWHGARAEKKNSDIALERSFDPTAGEVDLFPQDITRALLNLISNGFYAVTKRKAETNGGEYVPTLTASTKSLGDRVEIRIRDNGTGIPPEVKVKMFNPF